MQIDLLNPDNYRPGPYDMFRWLRENDPIHWHDEPGGTGFWAVTRYNDVKSLESRSDAFSSEPLSIIADSEPFGDADHKLLIYSDAPGHTQRRKFIGEELNPIPVRSQRDHMEDIVAEVIDSVIEKGECDLVEDVAGKLASFVIADMMGLTREQALELFPAAEVLTRGISTESGEGAAATQTVFTHAGMAWADRQGSDRDDWLSRLANSQTGALGGKPMDQMQFMLDFLLIINAGSDTTRNVIASGMWALMDNPDAYRELTEDTSLIPNAVEEIMRWAPPIAYQRRTATEDTEIGGQKIAKGDKIAGFYGSANRDSEVFENPDTFDIHRKINPHLTFGGGRHFCLGSHLARLELSVMFTELVTRIPDMKLAGPVEWFDYPELAAAAGPLKMPVTFTPGQRIGVDSTSGAHADK